LYSLVWGEKGRRETGFPEGAGAVDFRLMGLLRSLLVFTKPAVPGRVKTRLQPELSPAQSAELQAAFLADLCERLDQGDFELVIAWALENDEEPPADLLSQAVPAMRQFGADLGERLYNGLGAAALRSHLVAAVGSDQPDLPLEVVHEAFAALEDRADLVFGPASDGGYYLVGCRADALCHRLFEDIPWSGPDVMEVSLQRAREVGLRVLLLERRSDVDTPEDLADLELRLASGGTPCTRTMALLAAFGRTSPP